MPLKLITAPVTEPVTLTEAKTHLRVEHSEHDSMITALITSARQWCEAYLGRMLEPQTWDLYLDGFYGSGANRAGIRPDGLPVFGATLSSYYDAVNSYMGPANAWRRIDLPVAPVQEVVHVKYTDTAGALQTLSTSSYTVDIISEPGRIIPAYGTSWPDTRADINVVQIRFIGGYARVGSPDVSGVPGPIKDAIKLMLTDLYQNPGEAIVGRNVSQLPRGVEGLLMPYRVWRF